MHCLLVLEFRLDIPSVQHFLVPLDLTFLSRSALSCFSKVSGLTTVGALASRFDDSLNMQIQTNRQTSSRRLPQSLHSHFVCQYPAL